MQIAVRETKDANYFAYIGDLNEVFEFYVSSNTLNTALKKEGLTYQTGEKDSWNSEEDGAEWSKELAALLEYVKNNYFLCTETFLKDGGYYEMYDQFSEKYEARLEDFNELDIEEEVKAVEELKLKIENNFKQ